MSIASEVDNQRVFGGNVNEAYETESDHYGMGSVRSSRFRGAEENVKLQPMNSIYSS